jgi:hypothetical protein
MKNSITSTNLLLIVIALLLSWDIVSRPELLSVHAQAKSSEMTVAELDHPYLMPGRLAAFQKALNDAAQGGEVVAIVPDPSGKRFFAVFTHSR